MRKSITTRYFYSTAFLLVCGVALVLVVVIALRKAGYLELAQEHVVKMLKLLGVFVMVDLYFFGCDLLTEGFPAGSGAEVVAMLTTGPLAPFFWIEVVGCAVNAVIAFVPKLRTNPLIVIAAVLAIVGMLGPGLENVVLACVVAKWPWYARMMRTITLRYADRDFVRFARVAGYGTGHIIRRHLLPCAAGEISVLATLDTGAVILMVSALSFLGLGVQPPTPEWGMMLGEAREVMVLYPWQMLPPGLAILLVVAACNYLGDSLRDALDPRHAMHKEPVL